MSLITTLRVKAAPGPRVDAGALLPAQLCALPVAAIERMTLPAGNERCMVGDLFEVSQSSRAPDVTGGTDASNDEATLVIDGDAPWLDHVGARMTHGNLLVRGSAGDASGFQMTGGALRIEGNAGHFTACEMRGGRLTVRGHSGDFAAGARAGEMEGMTGGALTIHGNAGARLADRMRRGLVLVGGDAGEFAASRLVAGTVGVAGRLGAHYAYGMRRGTLLLAQRPDRLPPTFTEGGRGFEVFWALLVRSLANEIAPFSQWRAARPPTRYTGDLAVDGRGEILLAG
ncbi:formylmethanofuran dehydrogenase subunit C [Paraburkholderia unamae]|uniref:Formylmethanofuran dehydrogenase subunit C n=1 Tax=Paraburkholderia unamae TaxID=219649 RepID=A0ABX5KFB3_9BURK|nr:formylmethanofuran dehydrogenase subunit C [Paraburkholderia unamae]PVX77070.1 formylmethanofuran dehydrogenase subunit C [Paraburkholderia unamae]RAR56568.1 formylmethanofuran dehydrogenase subunit C [Paraburkholderia unamae]CAG9269621.1 Formylmethanofuran dehydrogenase subunit C [Paraburkholderia unamae]